MKKNIFKILLFAVMFFSFQINASALNNNMILNITNHKSSDTLLAVSSECTSLLGDPKTEGTPAFYLNIAFRVIKYAAIILLIIFTIMDFLSATASQDNDALKKSISKATKRLIYCLIIFVLPYLLEAVLVFINDQAMSACGIGKGA